MIQRSSNGPNALGMAGDGLGYGGLTPSVAVAVQPNRQGLGGDQIVLVQNGDLDQLLYSYWQSGWPAFGQTLRLFIDYWPQTQILRVAGDIPLNHPVFSGEPLFERTISLSSALGGLSWVGFTASTADTTAAQDVLNWHLDNQRRDLTRVQFALSRGASGPDEARASFAVSDLEYPAQTPSGHVQLIVDDVPVGSAVELDATGHATTTVSMTGGVHVVSAVYRADGPDFSDTRDTILYTVAADQTQTTLTSSAAHPTIGQSVTFTARVSDSDEPGLTPTGHVQFSIDGDAAGNPVALDEHGTATFTTASLASGTRAVIAAYQPDRPAAFVSSQAELAQGVERLKTATTLTVEPDPTVAGQDAMFRAVVQADPPASGQPTGTVVFTEADGTPFAAAEIHDGRAQAPASASAGHYTVRAAYSGDQRFAASVGSADQTVLRAKTKTTIASAPNPVAAGSKVSFTITVTTLAPGDVEPLGTVALRVDGVDASDPFELEDLPDDPDSGVVVLTGTATGAARTDAISASYSGDEDTEPSTSAALLQTVTAAPAAPAVATPTPAASPPARATQATSAKELAAMTATLTRALKRSGRAALTTTRQRLTVAAPGKLQQQVFATPAEGAPHAKPMLLASATHRFATAGSGTIRLRLTPIGRRALRRKATLTARIVTTFTPKHGTPITSETGLKIRSPAQARAAARPTGPGGWIMIASRH